MQQAHPGEGWAESRSRENLLRYDFGNDRSGRRHASDHDGDIVGLEVRLVQQRELDEIAGDLGAGAPTLAGPQQNLDDLEHENVVGDVQLSVDLGDPFGLEQNLIVGLLGPQPIHHHVDDVLVNHIVQSVAAEQQGIGVWARGFVELDFVRSSTNMASYDAVVRAHHPLGLCESRVILLNQGVVSCYLNPALAGDHHVAASVADVGDDQVARALIDPRSRHHTAGQVAFVDTLGV